jgi:hypothetical protein
VARATGVTQPPKFTESDKIRRTLALTGVTQIALQPCDMPAEFVMDHFSRGEMKDRAAWLKLAHNQSDTIKQVTDALRDTVGGPDFARLVAMARWKLGPTATGVFIDRPNIIHYRIWATEVDTGGTTMREGIDLAFTSTASLDPKDSAFAARVTQGVADTLAEHLGADARVRKDWAENTIRVFEIAAEKKLAAPVVIRTLADLDTLGLTPDVRARAAADVAAGNVLVLAKLDTGRSGWWRVDAKTGQTLGVMDNGYHATTVEYKTSNRPPAGPARAQYLKKMMRDRFNDLDTDGYMKLIGEDTLYMDEWEMVLQLQGKAGRKALSLTQEILLGRLRGF